MAVGSRGLGPRDEVATPPVQHVTLSAVGRQESSSPSLSLSSYCSCESPRLDSLEPFPATPSAPTLAAPQDDDGLLGRGILQGLAVNKPANDPQTEVPTLLRMSPDEPADRAAEPPSMEDFLSSPVTSRWTTNPSRSAAGSMLAPARDRARGSVDSGKGVAEGEHTPGTRGDPLAVGAESRAATGGGGGAAPPCQLCQSYRVQLEAVQGTQTLLQNDKQQLMGDLRQLTESGAQQVASLQQQIEGHTQQNMILAQELSTQQETTFALYQQLQAQQAQLENGQLDLAGRDAQLSEYMTALQQVRDELTAAKHDFATQLEQVQGQHKSETTRAEKAEVNILKLRMHIQTQVMEKSLEKCQESVQQCTRVITRLREHKMSVPKEVESCLEQWRDFESKVKAMKDDIEKAIQSHISRVKMGSPLSSLPKLQVPPPPPAPDAKIPAHLLGLAVPEGSALPLALYGHTLGAVGGTLTGLTPITPGDQPARPTLKGGEATRRTPPLGAVAGVTSSGWVQATPRAPSPFTVEAPRRPNEAGDAPAPARPSPTPSPCRASPVPAPAAARAAQPSCRPTKQESWVSVAKPTGKQGKNSFTRITRMLEVLFPNKQSTEIAHYIQRLRSSRGGSLSGLTHQDIVCQAAEIITSEDAVHPPKSPTAATRAPPDGELPTMTPEAIFEEEEDPCIICHDELASHSTRTLDCGHRFHTYCIKKWFNEQTTCPMCREHTLDHEDFPALK